MNRQITSSILGLLVFVFSSVCSLAQVFNPAGPIPLVQTVPLTNALYGRVGITNMMLLVRGDNVIGDGGGGVFAWLHGDTNTADNARYFAATNGGNWYKISYWYDGTGGGGGGGGLGTNAFVNGVLFQPIMFTNNLSSDVGRLMWYTNANGHVVGYATNVASATTPSYVAAASSGELTNAYFQATSDIFYNVSGTNIQAYLVTEAVEDLIGASLVAGSNIAISYDDGGTGKTTISGISSGATNGTPVSVDSGGTLVAANFTDTTGINFGVSGTNVTANLTDRDWGDITTSSSGTSVAINANSVTLGTDTTGNYIATIAGTANEVDASGSGSETAGVIVSLPATIDLGGKTSFEVPNAAAPTVDAFGEVAGDNDAWAAGRGALLFYDGTAATRLVGVLASDTPSNGQVPKWNTGGTITWEDDSTGVGGSGTIVTVDGGADNTRVNLADTTGIGVTLSGTNASFALVDRDFGAVTVSGSGTSIALDDGTVTSNKVVAANITIDKLSASGTPLSTNFLAGDYAWKQVTTNMIPGLNAILATIGTGGGSGTGSVVTVNGGSDMSRANITTNGFGLLVTQSGTNILLSTTNNYPAGYYAGGFLPLFAGVSNALTGDLSMDQSSDVRLFMSETSRMLTDGYEVMGLRAYNGKLALHSFATNDLSAAEEFMVIDPSDLVGPTDIITFPNSGFNNKVVFEADVELNGNVIAGTQTLGTSNTTVATTAFVLQNAGGDSGSDTNWNGNPIASGTITNLTVQLFNSRRTFLPAFGGFYADGVFGQINAGSTFYPLVGSAIASGTAVYDVFANVVEDPYQRILISSSTTTNSGYVYRLTDSAYLLSGNEYAVTRLYIAQTNLSIVRAGFVDVFTGGASGGAVDGAYLELSGGLISGVTANNSSRTTTTTAFTPTMSNTNMVDLEVVIGTGATNVVFNVYTNKVIAWTDSLTNNIPTGAGRYTAAGVVATYSGTPMTTNLIYLGGFGVDRSLKN